tara:strand:+ start:597 stop:1172 length:576 start_codon:yes stop_codon:yes gene_type:complete
MNKAQRTVLVAGLLIAVAMVVYPPWVGVQSFKHGVPAGLRGNAALLGVLEGLELDIIYGPNVMGLGEGVYSPYEWWDGGGLTVENIRWLAQSAKAAGIRFYILPDVLFWRPGGALDILGIEPDFYEVRGVAVGRLLFQLLLVSMCTLLLFVTFRGKQGRVDRAGQSDSPGRHRQGTGGRRKKPSFKFKPKA